MPKSRKYSILTSFGFFFLVITMDTVQEKIFNDRSQRWLRVKLLAFEDCWPQFDSRDSQGEGDQPPKAVPTCTSPQLWTQAHSHRHHRHTQIPMGSCKTQVYLPVGMRTLTAALEQGLWTQGQPGVHRHSNKNRVYGNTEFLGLCHRLPLYPRPTRGTWVLSNVTFPWSLSAE